MTAGEQASVLPPPRDQPDARPARHWPLPRGALVRAGIAVLLVVALLLMGQRLVQMKRFLETLEHVQWALLLPMVALVIAYYAVKALRWTYYLGQAGLLVPRWRAGAAYLAGQWFMFTPAGELMRGYFLGGGVSFARAAPTVVAQALADFFALALVAAALVLGYPALAPVVLPLAVPIVALVLALAAPPLRHRAARWPLLRWLMAGKRRAVLEESAHLLGARQTLTALLFGVPAVLLGGLALYLGGLAVGLACWDLGRAVAVYAMMQLLGGLSASPHGIGAAEGSGLLLLTYLGVEPGAALAAVVLFRAVLLGLSALLGAPAVLALRIADRRRPQVTT